MGEWRGTDHIVEKGGTEEELAVVVRPFGDIDLRTIICPETIKHPEIEINKSYPQSIHTTSRAQESSDTTAH